MTRTGAFITTSVFFVLSVSSGLLATEWHVATPPLGNDSNPGTSELPFATIQKGINVASHGDTVIVAQGTYVQNIQFKGKNIVLASTDPLDPAVVADTIIDGNQLGTVVTFDGTENETCVLSGFTIRNGKTSSSGGGMCGGAYPTYTHATIQNNRITGNLAQYGDGGGLYYCNGTIQNNTITNNSAGGSGGGLGGCGGNIQNNTITGNSAGLEGGGLYYCEGTIQNNTITNNSAGGSGGGLGGCGGTIRNCIIWGNTAPTGPHLHESSLPSFSCIEGWNGGGQGNTASEPRFVNPKARDYHVQEGSPCIDAGANYYWFAWPQWDRDGNCRLAGPAVDMGCYEYGSYADADGDLLSDSDESAAGTDPRGDDSDSDGLRDGLELLRGSNPLQVTPPGILNVPSDLATIQESLCVSLAGDEVIVAPGTYRENLQFCGPDIILRSSDPGDANVVGSTVIDGGGAGPVVSFMGGETEACVLAGFMIRNGDALSGAGITGNGTLATIQNNRITNNSAGRSGGGLGGCGGTIQNNTITGNSAYQGGGLYECNGTIQNNTITGNSGEWGGGLGGCGGTIQNNTITGNSAETGGGLYECYGTIQNNTITGNLAQYGGGGGLYWCNGTIQHNTITGNSAAYGGGVYECNGTIQNNTIAGNSAGQDGGGLKLCNGTIQNNTITGNSVTGDGSVGGGLAYCGGTIQNNTITRNSARGDYSVGGGLYWCNGTIQNNTITGNSATGDYSVGGGLYSCNGTIGNCIIWGNTAPTGPNLHQSSVPTYSCIENWSAGGQGNIKTDPQFLSVKAHDYHLQAGSPCIDAGLNDAWMWTATDLDGNPRVFNGGVSLTVDMGAYEYGSAPFSITQVLVEASGGLQLTWSSRPGDEYVVWSRTDLTSGDWTQEATVPSAGNSSSWTDPSPSGSRKFYRVEQL